MPVGPELARDLLYYQRNEITEQHFYKRLAASIRTPKNRTVLREMSDQELRHYRIWRQYTGVDTRPASIRLQGQLLLARLPGFTCAIQLMELSEARAKTHYRHSFDKIPEAASIVEDEIRHEAELIELLDERHLRHVSSIILGLNDALIEMLPATRRRYGGNQHEHSSTMDTISWHEVTNLDAAPCLYDGDGENGIEIYFENEADLEIQRSLGNDHNIVLEGNKPADYIAES